MRQIKRAPWPFSAMPAGAFMTLCALDDFAEQGTQMTVTDLAELQGISRAGVSQMLRSLEDKGLVERHPRPTDRRVVCVSLTPAGQAAMQEAKSILECAMQRVLEALGEDAQQLGVLLDRFCAILDALDEQMQLVLEERKEEHCVDTSST